ncbi:MAG TPA: ABC transporter ATP-binding protein [Candidatus Methylomirabilis sp.]|nr:ABC transporter ATP-binding protein [Candidatus Methylomirabilis sp.]
MDTRTRSGNLKRFLAYLKPYRGWLLLSTVVGVVKYNLPVVFPWILKDVIDILVTGNGRGARFSFDQLMGVAVVVFVVYALVTALRTQLADRLAHRMIFDIRRDLFRHIQRLPLDFYHANQTGAISSRLISDVSQAQNFLGLAGTNFFMDFTSLLTITGVVFVLNWKLALVTYSTLPIYLLLQRRLRRRMRMNSREARRRMEILEGGIHESVAGISEIKSFTHEGEQSRRFADRCWAYLLSAYENVRTNANSQGTTALLTRVPAVLVIWIGGHFVLQGELSLGALMAFYAYLEMVYNPLTRLGELNIQLANSQAAIDRLFEFFDLATEAGTDGQGPSLVVHAGGIRVQGVIFAYRPGQPVLKGITLTIGPGSRVALVGASGAGKSTLVKLLVRFHDAWEGTITIDGQDIRGVNLQSLRSQVGYVQQDPMLFSGTVEDNIRVGKPGAGEREIVRAAELANALEFIRQLPNAFQTEIGERGVRLSGGQKQRIAIARAFLKNAPILVLDESTSSLDIPSERLVHEALDRLARGRTTIIIAHRLSTVAIADWIFVLEAGRLVQQGTHEALLRETGGPYWRLCAEQMQTFMPPPTGQTAHPISIPDGRHG